MILDIIFSNNCQALVRLSLLTEADGHFASVLSLALEAALADLEGTSPC
jgi:hypothetical protein